MNAQNASTAARPQATPRLLICDTACQAAETLQGDAQWVFSPLHCLSRAVDAPPERIVIHFGRISLATRDILVELAAVLKGNRHTRGCRLLALLPAKQRQVIAELHRAGVDFAKVIGDQKLDLPALQALIEALGPEDRSERLLAELCPFLHYSRIDARHELTVCGAYLDRMVLGGDRLHQACETAGHLHCEHYLKPRSEYGEGRL